VIFDDGCANYLFSVPPSASMAGCLSEIGVEQRGTRNDVVSCLYLCLQGKDVNVRRNRRVRKEAASRPSPQN
jgi:hypothetical protein